jgi:hypothetical protein
VHEDVAIITFLVEHHKFHEVTGNMIWKNMESLEVSTRIKAPVDDSVVESTWDHLKSNGIPLSWPSSMGQSLNHWHQCLPIIMSERRRRRISGLFLQFFLMSGRSAFSL